MTSGTESTKKMLSVRVLSPAGPLYDAPAVSVTAKNSVGTFDVLFDHANFFSLLVPSKVIIDTGPEKVTFPINRGLLKVHANVVTLFVGITATNISS